MAITLTFKIYNFPDNFEEVHKEHFDKIISVLNEANLLSQNITEIIITDKIEDEINSYCSERKFPIELTKSREYKAISKIVDFDKTKKIFFDATVVNLLNKYSTQIFIEQAIEVFAEDILNKTYTRESFYSVTTSLTELTEIFLTQWLKMAISNILRSRLSYERQIIHTTVKIYIDTFKRNIKKLHYMYQKNQNLDDFWLETTKELDRLIRRCLEVRFDNGDFKDLQEFQNIIPEILDKIEVQKENYLDDKEIEVKDLVESISELLKICLINVEHNSNLKSNSIKIIDSPKKLFKNNLIDTETRIVAFIDILGFSAIIEEYDSDETSNLLNELHDTLDQAIKISIENILDQKVRTDLQEYLEYRMFSDCICISLPYIEFGNDFHQQFHSLAFVVKSYQIAMMQKGFFVRGGISIGSYFSDKNMIFSGGLVKAYKLETKVVNPIIAVDKSIIERLSLNYLQNVEGLFYENLFIFSNDNPDIIFINSLDILDNSVKHIDYIQNVLSELINENETEDNDEIGKLGNNLLQLTKSFTEPLYNQLKNSLDNETMEVAKNIMLGFVKDAINKHSDLLEKNSKNEEFVKAMEKVILKYKFLEDWILWTMKKNENFSFYQFK
ncbi:hypothetical protein ACFO4P_06435 [Epilithonimonas pallida]|uniref:Guanylate cyclase domain-containing protein n=1 Tax=Epilithonimonas pallida TaxID=373671 RepID=A0ABY1R6N2_9FLAO|nr:hypothetical protein [Epilithonimonas pallida]SMP96547.1 hypothetical protein SAMN05421679_109103 [Epilithonimonas pallida]